MQLHRILLLFIVVSGPLMAATMYTIQDLGTLGGSAQGLAVNASGQVTGTSSLDLISGQLHAFSWSSGVMQDLGTLSNSYNYSIGLGINASGQITGDSKIASGDTRAFLWSGGSLQDIGTLGGATSNGRDINDAGRITGSSQAGSGQFHAFIWNGISMQDLGTLPGGSRSVGDSINASGQVAGWADDASGVTIHAVLWNGSSLQDLGTLPGGSGSSAYGINDSGWVTGVSTGGSGGGIFLWNGSAMLDLGSLGGSGGVGRAINSSGHVTGMSRNINNQDRAIVWDGTLLIDLNTVLVNGAGWTLTQGYGINDQGQITGEGLIRGQTHAFLLTPVSDVPEPGTWTLAIAGLLSLALAKYRRFRPVR